MTTMITEVYDAFRGTGASDERAREAEALSAHENRFDDIIRLINGLWHQVGHRFEDAESNLNRRILATPLKLLVH